MKFEINPDGLLRISAAGQTFICTVNQFKQLEPNFAYLEGAYEAWRQAEDGSTKHFVVIDGNQQPAPSELVDREVYASNIASYMGAVPQPWEQPASGPEPAMVLAGFKAAFISSTAWKRIRADLPPWAVAQISGTSTLAGLALTWNEAVGELADSDQVTADEIAEMQALADEYTIPLNFTDSGEVQTQ